MLYFVVLILLEQNLCLAFCSGLLKVIVLCCSSLSLSLVVFQSRTNFCSWSHHPRGVRRGLPEGPLVP